MSALLENSMVISVAVGGGVLAIAWLLMDLLTTKKPRAEERLEEFKDPSLRRSREEGKSTGGLFAAF
jgi:hypothetical protein